VERDERFSRCEPQAAGVITPEVGLRIQSHRFETSYLGKTRENPSCLSRHYKKQSPFEGSVRQVRGRILSFLFRNGHTLKSDLSLGIDLPKEQIDPVLASIVEEEFIVMDQDIVKIT
jgi:hypothetical protein